MFPAVANEVPFANSTFGRLPVPVIVGAAPVNFSKPVPVVAVVEEKISPAFARATPPVKLRVRTFPLIFILPLFVTVLENEELAPKMACDAALLLVNVPVNVPVALTVITPVAASFTTSYPVENTSPDWPSVIAPPPVLITPLVAVAPRSAADRTANEPVLVLERITETKPLLV